MHYVHNIAANAMCCTPNPSAKT